MVPCADDDGEELLAGGVANPGAVVRVGDTVRRPVKPQTASVHRFLRHLVEHGLEGVVPTPLGFDDKGREILSFLGGDIALPPYPDWVADDALLDGVAQLQRRLHAAAASFVISTSDVWDDSAYQPPGVEGPLVCHNDLCVENVVVRDGLATGFIDFDYARPADPLFDVAVAIRHWAPLRAPEDLEPSRASVDVVARFRRFLDLHELRRTERIRVVEILGLFFNTAFDNVQRLAADGHVGFAQMIADGYLEQNRRSEAWVQINASRLVG